MNIQQSILIMVSWTRLAQTFQTPVLEIPPRGALPVTRRRSFHIMHSLLWLVVVAATGASYHYNRIFTSHFHTL